MRVKIIECNSTKNEYEAKLEEKINDFIKGRDDILDIKYSISNGGTYSHVIYNAMIIMKD